MIGRIRSWFTSHPPPPVKHRRIPQTVRRDVWLTHIGEKFHGKCYVCEKKIDPFQFEASHVVAQTQGGSNVVENLRPCCALCNRSMGIQNLELFKKEYYHK